MSPGIRLSARTRFTLPFIGAVVVALAMLGSMAHAQCRYEVTTIIRGPHCQGGGRMPVTVLGINEIGQAVGFVDDCTDPNIAYPFVWAEDFGLVRLPMPEGYVDGEARAINNVGGVDGIGTIICSLRHISIPLDQAFRYDDGQWTLIPASAGFYSSAQAINDEGQITGSRMTPNGLCGFRWQNGAFTDIMPSQRDAYALGNDINAAGFVAGELAGPNHAFWWDGDGLFDLGAVLAGPSAFARSINTHGDMAGGAMVTRGRTRTSKLHAFVHDGKTGEDLTIPPGFDASIGLKINDAKQVLVRASVFVPLGAIRSYIWQHESLEQIDKLVDCPPDVEIGHRAEDINNRGQIATTGEYHGSQVGLILSPKTHAVADVNFDCAVDSNDIIALLDSWGPCPQRGTCLADVVDSVSFQPPGDGKVDGADLAYVLGNWDPHTNE